MKSTRVIAREALSSKPISELKNIYRNLWPASADNTELSVEALAENEKHKYYVNRLAEAVYYGKLKI